MKFTLKYPKQRKIYAFTIRAYEDREWTTREGKGCIKVGQTNRTATERIKEQVNVELDFPTLFFEEPALTNAGKLFSDHDVHYVLEGKGVHRPAGEWFEATIIEIREAVDIVKLGRPTKASQTFSMRKEQQNAVTQTANYLRAQPASSARHFLWNAKMRFGKTFTAYQLAKEMGWKRLLILTYKPVVAHAWRDDLYNHKDFEDWQFIGKNDRFEDQDKERPIVCFISFQDLKTTPKGKIKPRLKPAYEETWDCIILDEYHYGAWRKDAKELYENDTTETQPKGYNKHILAKNFEGNNWLYLSGTPFRALATGEFSEDRIFNWTYADEQNEKQKHQDEENNPYEGLPEMVLMTYELPKKVRKYATETLDNQFSLNAFFEANERENKRGYAFTHEEYVKIWLQWIRGKLIGEKPEYLPYDINSIKNGTEHTLWYLPSVAACHAMKELLNGKKVDKAWKEYIVIVAAGEEAGTGEDALKPVRKAIGDGTKTKTITLTCGKLTTGVTVPQWGAILMLRDTQSPEAYYQSAFRVASPALREIKEQAYIFDFSPNRALKIIYDYCEGISKGRKHETKTKNEIERFLDILPVLCFRDGKMAELDATEVLNIISHDIGSAMLASRWQSKSMVNLDDDTLRKIQTNPKLVEIINKIPVHRKSGSKDRKIIIGKEEALVSPDGKKTKKKSYKVDTDDKELRDFGNIVEQKFMAFMGRIPIFMYLTDYREEALIDIIKSHDPDTFTKSTGLTMDEFNLLLAAGVFKEDVMNKTIHEFRERENFNLEYAGGDAPDLGGGWSNPK